MSQLGLKGRHPTVCFLFFLVVVPASMLLMHPISLVISIACSCACALRCAGWDRLRSVLRFALPVAILAAVCNPLFSHEGVTVLRYFRSGNPLTLESIGYGVASAVMLISMLLWFVCLNAVLTADRITYLFGRISPAFSILFSMTLQFVSRLNHRRKEILQARRLLGLGTQSAGLPARMRNAVSVFSILATWALENAVVTADSMRARGYGSTRPTSYSIFRFTRQDALTVGFIAAMGAGILGFCLLDQLSWQYYPYQAFSGGTGATALLFQGLLMGFPLILERWEARAWHY